LALIVLLFIVGVGCSATHGGDGTTHQSWTTTLQDLLVKKATASDLRADPGSCIQGSSVVVPAAGTCLFGIDDTRRVLLSPSQGVAAITLTPQRGFGGTQKPTANGGYDFTVSKGDTFSVTCVAVPGSSPCKLGLSS
jgi:hypothetical protein